MKTLNFNDFERYDIILNDENKESNQTRHWQDLKKDEYCWSNDFNSFCGGSMPKIFARVTSSALEQLFNELKKPKCHYVTYLNGLAKNSQTNPPLEKVSVLLKKTHFATASDIEELASLTANAMQVPTVYNKSVIVDDKKYVLSVDFISDNETFSPLLFCSNINEYPLEDCIEYLNDYLRLFVPNLSEKDASQIREGFIPIYFYRKYIIKDKDFCGKNIGLLYNNNTNSHKLAPCFDMEVSFTPLMIDYAYEHMGCDLMFAIKKFPQTTKNTITNFKNAINNHLVENSIQNSDLEIKKKEYINFAQNNTTMLIEKYDSLTKTNERTLQ